MTPEPAWPWERRRWPMPAVLGLVLAIVCPCTGAFGLLTILGLGMESGYFPDSKAVPGEKLSERSLRFLREKGLIDEAEQVLYFYSGGVLDIEGDGSFFTDARVVRYYEDLMSGEFVSQSATYDAIASIEPELSDDWMGDSTIRVTRDDGEEILLAVCNDERGDREFLKRLKQEWERRRGPR